MVPCRENIQTIKVYHLWVVSSHGRPSSRGSSKEVWTTEACMCSCKNARPCFRKCCQLMYPSMPETANASPSLDRQRFLQCWASPNVSALPLQSTVGHRLLFTRLFCFHEWCHLFEHSQEWCLLLFSVFSWECSTKHQRCCKCLPSFFEVCFSGKYDFVCTVHLFTETLSASFPKLKTILAKRKNVFRHQKKKKKKHCRTAVSTKMNESTAGNSGCGDIPARASFHSLLTYLNHKWYSVI